jgi:hypothetical protein
MNRRRTLLLAACLLFIAAPTSADEQPQPATANQPRLQLANGDYLAGRLSTSDQADVIAWQTDFAAEPLRFPFTYVNGIHFAKHQPAAAEGEFAFELTGGDGLSGQLKRLDDKTIEIQSKSLGSLTLDRAQVHRIVRLAKDQQVRYRGPDGLTGWQVAAGNWTEQAGRLTADKPASAFLHEFPIPKRASIELELSWKTKPDFTLSFGGLSPVLNAAANNVRRVINGAIVVNARPQPQQQKSSPTVFSLECWKNSLVLVRELDKAADLALVQSLEETAGSLRLHILYDEETGHVAVYSQAGALLAEVTVSGEGSPKVGGVNLVNKTGDITLEHLVIQEWLGDLPAKVDLAKPTLRRKDGAIVDGAKATFDAAAQQFIIARENAAPATIPAADVQELSLNPRNLAHVQIDLAERPLVASLLDGTRLSGRVLAVSEKSLKLKRPGLKDPVDLPLDLIRSMATSSVKPHPQRPDGRYGRLQTKGSSIKGALGDAQSSDDQPALAWQPQGALNAAPLAPGLSAAIYYREPPKRSAKPKLTQQEQLRRRLLAQQQIVVQQRQPGLLGIINGNRAARTRATLPLLAEELLWLKAGDRLTCKLKSIDERGITFESPLVESTFLPHEAVKAWERAKSRDDLNADKRERLLTLPRMQRPNPPTHLVESIDGDLIRGRLQSMDADSMTLEVRLEPKQIPFERVARIIWLDAPKKDDPKKDDPKKVEAAARPEEQPAQPAAEVALNADAVVLEPFDASLEEVDPDRPEPEQPPAAKLDVVLPPNSVQVVREDGVRLTFVPDRVAQGAIDGKSDL